MSNNERELNKYIENERKEYREIADSTIENAQTGYNIVKGKFGRKAAASAAGGVIGSVVGSGIATAVGLTFAPGFIVGGIVAAVIGNNLASKEK